MTCLFLVFSLALTDEYSSVVLYAAHDGIKFSKI